MTLFMIRLDPDAHAAARWFSGEGLLPGRSEDGAYQWHALLTAAFGKAMAPKPFRLMLRRGRPPQILAYTTRPPEVLEAAARDFADPLVLTALGIDRQALAAKPMPAFTTGRRFGFSIYVRPTVRTDRDGDRHRSIETDAHVVALRRAEAEGTEAPPRAVVYGDWARAKLEAGGARAVALSLDGIDQSTSLRRNSERRLVAINGHSAHVSGILEVVDADSFGALVARGVGRHRAFGYGMLLLSAG